MPVQTPERIEERGARFDFRLSQTLDGHHIIHLTLKDQQALLEALDAPDKEPTEKARCAAAKYKKDVDDGRVVIQH
jgi:hypothetical protein